MSKTPKIIVSDRVRIPKSLIPQKVIKSRYVKTIYADDKCNKCKNLENRHYQDEICQSCPSFLGRFVLVNKKEARDDGVWSVPQGDLTELVRLLESKDRKFKLVDKREVKPLKHKIKFTGSLFNGEEFRGSPTAKQQKAVDQWMKYKTGGLIAPPRSGKTVIATYIMCELQQKTVIITHSKDLLNQFHETMTGVPAENFIKKGEKVKAGRNAMTNIPAIREKTGKQVVYMPKSYDELKRFVKRNKELPDILLISYQSFIRDASAEKRIKGLLNKHYSFSIIDEVHNASAGKYMKFTSMLDMKHRLTLTATDKRKDGLDVISKILNGQVVSKVKLIALQPRITFKKSKVMPKRKYTSWQGAISWLYGSRDRTIEIAKQAFADMRRGHSVIIIPVERLAQQEALVKLINHQAKVNRKKRGEKWPKTLAMAYNKDAEKLTVLNWIDSYEKGDGVVSDDCDARSPRVVVAIRRMFKEGIDVKRPSMLYLQIPMSANAQAGGPAFYQMATRVCTPYEGKPPPEVRIWIDNINMFRSCAVSLTMHEIVKNSTIAKSAKKALYILNKEDYDYGKKFIFQKVEADKPDNKWY